MILPFKTRAAGKLLFTGEYFIIDGAIGFATPVKLGQKLEASEGTIADCLHWQSITDQGEMWFEAVFSLPDLEIIKSNDAPTALTLKQILYSCKSQNKNFLAQKQPVLVATRNEFPKEWGLGTSSTLIAMLAKWANINAYQVLNETMGGSGYDLACAYVEKAILYQRNELQPIIQELDYQPKFTKNLYFIFLGKKQNSREGILRYKELAKKNSKLQAKLSALTQQFIKAKTLASLEKIIVKHENLIANALNLPRAKDLYFSDFWGEVKSLGAWGGDFVLITNEKSEQELLDYCNKKGFDVVISWKKMIG
jgi:mevalonate kinase